MVDAALHLIIVLRNPGYGSTKTNFSRFNARSRLDGECEAELNGLLMGKETETKKRQNPALT